MADDQLKLLEGGSGGDVHEVRPLVPEIDDREDESGQGMVEYAFIMVLMVLVLILIFTVISKQTNNLYSNIQNGLANH